MRYLGLVDVTCLELYILAGLTDASTWISGFELHQDPAFSKISLREIRLLVPALSTQQPPQIETKMTPPTSPNEAQSTKRLLDVLDARRAEIQKLHLQFAEDDGEVTIPGAQASATAQADANQNELRSIAAAVSAVQDEEKKKREAHAAAEKRLEEAEKRLAASKGRVVQLAKQRPDVLGELVDALGSAAPAGLSVQAELAKSRQRVKELEEKVGRLGLAKCDGCEELREKLEQATHQCETVEAARVAAYRAQQAAEKDGSSMRRELDNAHNACHVSEKARDAAVAHVESLEERLQEALDRIRNLEDDCGESAAAKEVVERQLAEAERQLAAALGASEKAEERLLDALRAKDAVTRQLADTSAAKAVADRQLANALAAKANVDRQLANVSAAKTTLEEKLATARGQVTTTLADLHRARTRLEEAQDEIDDHVRINSDMTQALDSLPDAYAADLRKLEQNHASHTAELEGKFRQERAQQDAHHSLAMSEKQAEVETLQEELANLRRLAAVLAGQSGCGTYKSVAVASLISGEETDRPARETPEAAWVVTAPWLSSDALEAVAVPEGDELLARLHVRASCGDLASPGTLALVASLTATVRTAPTLKVEAVAEVVRQAEGIRGGEDQGAENAAVFAWWQLAWMFGQCWLELPAVDRISDRLTGPFKQLAEAVSTGNSVREAAQGLGEVFGSLVVIRADAHHLLMVDPHATALTVVARTQTKPGYFQGTILAPAGVEDIVFDLDTVEQKWAWGRLILEQQWL